MDSAVTPRLTDAERRERVERRAGELLAEAFRAHPPANAWFDEKDIARRDACFQQAQDELELEFGVASWSPPGRSDDTDWSGDPRAGLRRALAEREFAEQARDEAGAIADRAAQRVVACEAEMAAFKDLEAETEAFHLQQLREGGHEETPWVLQEAAKDRARCLDRSEIARRASMTLASELRAAERRLQECYRVVDLWAVKVILDHSEQLADALEAVQAEADQRRDVLNGLAHAHFPHSPGPAALSHRVQTVLHAPARGLEEKWIKVQPRAQEWLELHTKLRIDPGLAIELA